MPLLKKAQSLLRNLFHFKVVEADLDEEVRSHLEMLTDENVRAGMTHEEARRIARIELGGVEQVKEEVREQRAGIVIESIFSDCRVAVRRLGKTPTFTAVAVLTVALGIGATTAIFSIVNSALLRPLAYREPQRLYLVREIVPQFAKSAPILDTNLPDFRIWQKRVRSFEDVAIAEGTTADLSGSGDPEVLRGVRASANIFSVLGIQPSLGRAFRSEEDEPGRGHVLILTDAFWRARFHSDAGAVGKSLLLDGMPHEIVGVLPASFPFPQVLGGTSNYTRLAFFKPLNGPAEYEQGLIGEFDFAAVARLRANVTQEQALAELNVVQAQIAKEANEGLDLQGVLQPLEAEVVGPARRGLLFLLASVGAVLLIVCANLASLLLARVPGRMREAAIRASIGATRMRIMRQLLTECFLISVAGGVLGISMAFLGVKWLVHLAPPGIPRLNEVIVDGRVLGFASFISLATGAMFGVFPALRASRSQPLDVLKSGGAATTESGRTRRLRQSLVGLEVGLTTVLLILAGLLMASLGQLLGVRAGFATEDVLVASMDLPVQKYSQAADRLQFYDRVLAGVQTLPGVRAAGWVSLAPLGGEGSVTGIALPGASGPRSEMPMANYRPASPEYFSAAGIPLQQGRVFAATDRGRKIVMVSQSIADRFWPGKNPIGQTIITQWGPDIPAEVVGVVGDIRTVRLDAEPVMMVYVPEWFNSLSVPGSASFVVRTANDPGTYAAGIRELVRSIDAEVPLTTLRPMSEIVSHSLDARRFPMALATVFAVASLLLASLGIFGVLGYSVQQRYQELGIRTAFGANLRTLLCMVLVQGMAPVMIGLAAGATAALFAGRLIGSMLFGVSAHDPFTFVTVAVVVSGVALMACYIPARRAMHVDPMVALRYE